MVTCVTLTTPKRNVYPVSLWADAGIKPGSGEAGERPVADVQRLAGDVPGCRGGQEQRQSGDLGGDGRCRARDAVVAGFGATAGRDR